MRTGHTPMLIIAAYLVLIVLQNPIFCQALEGGAGGSATAKTFKATTAFSTSGVPVPIVIAKFPDVFIFAASPSIHFFHFISKKLRFHCLANERRTIHSGLLHHGVNFLEQICRNGD